MNSDVNIPSLTPTCRRPEFRRAAASGFTFVEVLFAIIILGVGSIMLAGMLPVAIKQSADTRNDLTGRSVAEAGFSYVKVVAASAPNGLPPTNALTVAGLNNAAAFPGPIVPLNYRVIEANLAAPNSLAPFQAIHGSRIFSHDSRFQWLAFYGRAADSSIARVIVLALRLQNTDPIDRYSAATLQNEEVNADNGPMLAGEVEIVDGGPLEPDRLIFSSDSSNDAAVLAADTGAFAIVAASENDTTATGDRTRSQRNNGRVFRLAARRIDLDATGRTFDLQPGFDLVAAALGPDGLPNTADDLADGSMNTLPVSNPAGGYPTGGTTRTQGKPVQVWLVGKGLKDPTAAASAGNTYTGLVQDISVLSVDLPLGQ